MKTNKYKLRGLAAIALCITSILFYSCSNENIKGDLDKIPSETTVVTESTEVPEITEEPPVVTTEAPSVQRSDPCAVRIRPETHENDEICSVILSTEEEPVYSVKDGYYQINFLSDKLFEEEINKDIKDSMDSLRNFHNEDYSEDAVRSHSSEVIATDGISADIIIRNGYLSIMLEYGYTKPFSASQTGDYTTLADGENIYFDHAVTLNYELISKNKITDFSDLFYNDSDWNQAVRYAEDYEHRGNVPYFAEEKPELFTIDYIVYETDYGLSAARYSSRDLNLSYCSDMIPSFYRDMRSISNAAANIPYKTVSENTQRLCQFCGEYYMYHSFSSSRFLSDERISELNASLDALYDRGFPGREAHDCVELRNPPANINNYPPDSCRILIHMNLWKSTDKDNNIVFFDPDTLERVNVSAILGSGWREYVTNETNANIYAEEPDLFTELRYDPSEGMVHAAFRLSNYYEICTVDIPADLVNQKYIQ